ncbi:hypothetical protein EDC94DRAFT_688877 [Helicostylum pulchrum]|nr:hypothetical protein EDC94DRAFT_688877 [Helicostylum pulchrum]
MGLNCHIFSLPPIDKNFLILQNIRSLSYPKTFFELKSGKIKLLLEGLEIIKNVMTDMKQHVHNLPGFLSGKISKIDIKGKSKLIDNQDWISEVFWDQTWFNEAEDIPDAEDIYASEPEDEYEDESSSCYLIVPRIVAPFSRKILNTLNLEEDKNSICKIVADYLTNHAISGWKYETVLRILIDHQLIKKLLNVASHKRQLLDEDAINRFQQEQQDRQYQQDEQSSQAALIDNVKNMTPNERIAFLCDKFGNGGYLDLTEDRIARRFKKCLKETTYDLELGLQPMITKGEKEMLMKIADCKSREDIETMFLSSVCLWEDLPSLRARNFYDLSRLEDLFQSMIMLSLEGAIQGFGYAIYRCKRQWAAGLLLQEAMKSERQAAKKTPEYWNKYQGYEVLGPFL